MAWRRRDGPEPGEALEAVTLLTLLLQESPEAVPEGAAAAAEHSAAAGHAAGAEPFNAGDMILEHILNSQSLEVPFVGHVQLPTLHLFGWDLPITKHVVMMWVVALFLLAVGLLAARVHRQSPGKVGHLIEMAILFIRDEIALPNIGEHGARFVPYLLTTFLFILFCNLLGLVPYGSTATGNISVTAGLAIMAFVMIQTAGVREYGLVKHLRHLVPQGVPLWLVPIMIRGGDLRDAGQALRPVHPSLRQHDRRARGHPLPHRADLHHEEPVRGARVRRLRPLHQPPGAAGGVHPGLHIHDADLPVHRDVGAPPLKPRGRAVNAISTGKETKEMELGPNALAHLAAGIGAGLTVMGGAAGIGKLAASAMDGTARQPQSANDIRTSMIIAAALIEGVTLFALVVCILLVLLKS